MLERRRSIISLSDAVPFVDYIWPNVGNPKISLEFTSCQVKVEGQIIFRDAVNDNGVFYYMLHGSSTGNRCAARVASKVFYIWHERSHASKVTQGITAQALTPYTVALTPDNNLSGQYFRLINYNKQSSTVALDYYQQIDITITPESGNKTLPLAYGPVTLYSTSGTAGAPIYTAFAKLRPCQYNGEYGLLDTMSGAFYGNIVAGASWTGGSIQS